MHILLQGKPSNDLTVLEPTMLDLQKLSETGIRVDGREIKVENNYIKIYDLFIIIHIFRYVLTVLLPMLLPSPASS